MSCRYVVSFVLLLAHVSNAWHAGSFHLRASSHSCTLQMAGFGGASKKGAGKKDKPASKATKLSMKRQWDRHQELVGSGSPRNLVFARIPGDEEWTPVGDVAAASGVDVAAAVQLHKRFILEHATRVSPRLALKAKSLECGFAAVGDEPSLLISKGLSPADPSGAGFEGAPDPSARYAAADSNLDAVKKMGLAEDGLKMGGY